MVKCIDMFEYLTLQLEELIPNGDLQQLPIRMNDLGQKGWELVSIPILGFTQGIQIWIFKRVLEVETKINPVKKTCENCNFFNPEDDLLGNCTFSNCCTNKNQSCKNFKIYISGENHA